MVSGTPHFKEPPKNKKKLVKMATSEKCACLSLHKSARIIGTVLFIMTVGLFVAYLIFIENLRRIVLEVS